MERQKIGIVGAGSVGATIAYACMVRGVGRHISIYDIAKSKVEAEVLDLNHGLMFTPETTVDGSDDLQVLAGSHVCLSMPAIVNRYGVDSILPVPLNDEEQRGLQTSADAILRVAHSLGF